MEQQATMSPKEEIETKGPTVNPDGKEAVQAIEEIETVSENLDSLNSVLDFMEKRTDDIRAQLIALLQSNREIREEFKDSNKNVVILSEEEMKDLPVD